MPNTAVKWTDWLLIVMNIGLGYYYRGTLLGFVLVLSALFLLWLIRENLS